MNKQQAAKPKWYLVKKKVNERWTAYKIAERPDLKRGYEMTGPYDSLAECMVRSNEERGYRE